MYNRVFTDNNNKNWQRIDKRKARRIYDQGMTIVVCADNLRPFSMYGLSLDINKNNDIYQFSSGGSLTFDERIKDFEIYNCINCETGYHAAFYMEVEQ